MKIKLYALYALMMMLAVCNKTSAQNANTTLSNLTSPTSINVNLLPDKDDRHNLGSPNKAWQNLYLDSAIYLHGKPFIKIPDALSWNTIVGIDAMHDEPASFGNTAIGYETMYKNTDGGENTAVGALAMVANTTGYSNTAMGYDALNHNTVGYFNTAMGYDAVYSDTSGSYNTGIGHYALHSNTSGSENVAVGDSAAYAQNTNVYSNTAIGARALRYNISGTANTACGSFALYKNKATNNSAFGNASLTDNTTGINNSAFGNSALYKNSAGSYNTALGENAGANVTNGSNNTFVGYNANCGSGGHLTNSVAIGNSAGVTTNNTVRIGNSSITSIGGYVNWSNVSDGRVKKNIKQNVPGLVFINKLNPITYNLDLDAADKILDADNKIIQPSADEIAARQLKEQVFYTGFVAQDVEKAAKSLNYDFSGVDKPGNANTLYGLRYSEFVVPIVKGMQELSVQNDSLKQIVTSLQLQINQLKALIVSGNSSASAAQPASVSSASLSQNVPNPFSNTTTINYSLPAKFSSAKIIITNENGNTLKQINLSNSSPTGGSWKGSVNVDASTLSSGAYQYSLYVDGTTIASKQMILTK